MCRIVVNDITSVVGNRETRGLGVRHECVKYAACERLKVIAVTARLFMRGWEL